MCHMAEEAWTGRVGHHDVRLVADPSTWKTRLRLEIDDEPRGEATLVDGRHTFSLDDEDRVTVVLGALGSVKRVTARIGDADLDLDAPPGSKAARRQELARERPVLYSIRHVLEGTAKVAWFVLGAALLARLIAWLRERFDWDVDLPTLPLPDVNLPSIPWPDISLPSIDWPSIPWPDISLPTPPDWLVWLLEHRNYFVPVVIGVVVAIWEVRRQRRQARMRAAAPDPTPTNAATHDRTSDRSPTAEDEGVKCPSPSDEATKSP